MKIYEKAELFAVAAHKGAKHKRKVTGLDYIEHPKEVVSFTKHFMNIVGITDKEEREDAIAAAWLHDTVEDTGIEHRDIQRWFGTSVADLVFFLSDEKTEMTREERNLASLRRLSGASRIAQIIKAADIAANFEDIRRTHRNSDERVQFKNYKRFIEEKRKVLGVLTWLRDSVIIDRLNQDFDAFLALKEKSNG